MNKKHIKTVKKLYEKLTLIRGGLIMAVKELSKQSIMKNQP